MKTVFLFLISICLIRVSYSQTLPEFAPVGAKWYYSKYCMGPCMGYNKFTSVDTATIKGLLFKKIIVSTDTLNLGNNFPLSSFYLYGDSNYMYYAKDLTDTIHLLADFNLGIGDTIITDLVEEEGAKARSIVDGKGDTSINGITLRYLNLTIVDVFSKYVYGGRVLQNIGCESALFPYNRLPDPSSGGSLRCYEDENIGKYVSPIGGYDCDFAYTGAEIIFAHKINIHISPNPSEDKIFVSHPSLSKGEIAIQNLLGETLAFKAVPINEAKTEIDVSSLIPGTYLLLLKNRDGITMKKFVKE